MPEPSTLVPGQRDSWQLAVVKASGFSVRIVRVRGERHLRLEAAMTGSNPQVFSADAGTADPRVAAENAVSFAAELDVAVRTETEVATCVAPTYRQLEAAVRARGQDVDGLLSRLRSFMATFGFSAEDRIGPELGGDLAQYRAKFRLELMRQKKAPRTIGPYLSKITKLGSIASAMAVVGGEGLAFAAVIKAAMQKKQITNAELGRAIGLNQGTLSQWLRDVCAPSPCTRKHFPRLEQELGLLPGILEQAAGALPPAAPSRVRPAAVPFASRLCEALQIAQMDVAERPSKRK